MWFKTTTLDGEGVALCTGIHFRCLLAFLSFFSPFASSACQICRRNKSGTLLWVYCMNLLYYGNGGCCTKLQWLVAARSGIALSPSPLPAHGTVYRGLSRDRRHCRLSSDIWRRTCLRPRRPTGGGCPSCFFLCLPNTSSFFLCVIYTCPYNCSVLNKCHVNLFVYNNNNNNNNKTAKQSLSIHPSCLFQTKVHRSLNML